MHESTLVKLHIASLHQFMLYKDNISHSHIDRLQNYISITYQTLLFIKQNLYCICDEFFLFFTLKLYPQNPTSLLILYNFPFCRVNNILFFYLMVQKVIQACIFGTLLDKWCKYWREAKCCQCSWLCARVPSFWMVTVAGSSCACIQQF